MRLSSREILIWAAMAVITVTILLALIDPMGSMGKFLPKCPLKWLTGYACPGCGSTRAIHAFLTGHPVEALAFNYFLPIAAIMIIGSLIAESAPTRFANLRRIIFSSTITYGFTALCIGWWIGRNLLNI